MGKTPAFRRQLEQILCRLGRLSDYRPRSHTTFSIHLHSVWITKYRQKGLRGEVAERGRAIVRAACQKARVDMLKGHSSADHVHVMVAIPPPGTISHIASSFCLHRCGFSRLCYTVISPAISI